MVGQAMDRPHAQDEALHFLFAPRLTHDRIDRLTPTQQAEALHEFVDIYQATKRHVFNPGKNPHTRVLALATLIDQAEKTCAKHKAISEPQPFWIGSSEQEGSFAARTGLGQNFISREHKAYERAGLIDRPHRRTDNGNDHIDLAVLPALMTETDLLPSKGERPRKPPVLCKSCGSEVLVKEVKTQVVCACCGTIHSEHKSQTMVNEPEEETPIITREVTIEETDIITSQVTIQTDTIITREVTIGVEEEEADSPPMTVSGDPDKAIITAWLEKRIGADFGIYFATGRLDTSAKYLPFYGPAFIDAYINGTPGNIYASRMRQADGSSWVWSADIDGQFTVVQIKDMLKRLACAGVHAVCWQRRPGRFHIEVYVSEARKAEDIDAFMLQLVPEFAELKERYPIHTNRLSWPLWYQIEKKVHACSGYYAEFDEPHQVRKFTMDTDQLTLHELAMLIESSVTPSALIPRLPDPEPTPEKPREKFKTVLNLPTSCDNPTKEQLIAAFNEANRITDYLPSEKDNPDGTYMARGTWRGEKGRPSVHVYPQTNTAYDRGTCERHDCLNIASLTTGKSISELMSETRKALLAARHRDTKIVIDVTKLETVVTKHPVEEQETLQGGLSAQKTVDFSHLPEEIQTLCREHNLTPAEPCSACGCPLHNRLDECARCYPVKSKPNNIPYAEYGSEIIDRVYPRPRPVQTVQFGGKSHAA